MKASTVTLALVVWFTSLAAAVEQERALDVFIWPFSAPKSSNLARVTYNSTGATLQSYIPPSIPGSIEVVRVGFYHPSGSWSGIVTAASHFTSGENKSKRLQLHLNGDGNVYHVGLVGSDLGGSSGTRKDSAKGDMSVEVIKMRSGPTPQLNKPVALSADGSPQDKEPEKTFLQKYWWAIAGFVVLQVVLSSGKQA